ncbi:nitroreductase family deazaflavin-dependent oxidoreductase [Phototrophicus methaneseepsis]|uniref:Nitroreductase family deazaflavin-dependent oxidoreductase n=1 Tax=Phototrophicus methaneseepsis TaxID=2710758 RepID=A0A7S8EBE0_9CHLR|nr:nitroreductase/quinone reductase family protein [Phototrophicus methaneseepsis]QPC83875.1 nitroreductase family deazaflavin-dependent oxidoreductase [Phototrophicus methaneseepsis]
MFATLKRWIYRGNRPSWIARALNAFWKAVHSSGRIPNWVTLEVIGRKSGKIIAFPVVAAVVDGDRYLVSMLGDEAQWVRNVRAAHGKAYIRSGGRSEVNLQEIPNEQRAPLIKAYLQVAPGARPHIPVDKDAPISAFEAIAADFPAFRIVPVGPA